MNYGVTPQGFVKMRLPEIRAEIIATATAKMSALAGKKVVLETSPNSILGPFIDTFAEREAAMWEHMEASYNAKYPNTADGVSLDNTLEFTGNRRLKPVKTKVFVLIKAPNGTLVKKGAVGQSGFDQQTYKLAADVSVTQNAAAAFRVQVKSIIANTAYTITVSGAAFSYTLATGGNANQILAAIATFLQSRLLTVTTGSGFLDVIGDGRSTVSVSVSNNLVISDVESVGTFEADQAGPFIVNEGDLIATAPNAASIRNVLPGVTGRYREDDLEVKQNYDIGPFRLGSGGVDAIKANIMRNVPGVSDVIIQENEGATVNSQGIPPGGIEVIVEGGNDQEIRNEIQRVKGASTPAYGLSLGTALDSEGESHPIGLTRPTRLFVWVQIRVMLKPGETVSATAFADVKDKVVERGNLYKTGDTVVLQQLMVPVLENLEAISNIELKLYVTPSSTYVPNVNEYNSSNIVPTIRQRAVFADSRVTVF
jgi:hypothetical protein